MKEYATYLFQRFLGLYIHIGVAELHIIFDSPNRSEVHQKDIERERRDVPADSNHEHIVFHNEMKIPNKWRDVIGCRSCKQSFVNYLGTCFLELGPSFLGGDQRLFVAGGSTALDRDTCWYTSKEAIEKVAVQFTSNAEEADTRVWLLAAHSYGTRKIIYSPDTDVYHIGLLNIQSQNEVFVQLNMLGKDFKFVNINALSEYMKNDNDLHEIDQLQINKIFTTLYVVTGCDFTSFFVGLSKGSFAKTLLAYPKLFITGNTKFAPGTLACHNPDGKGLLVCMRLVASTYFNKHRQAFSGMDPPGLYLSFQSQDTEDQHQMFYDHIREQIWSHITFEDEMPLSIEALERHWLRSIWTLDYWEQSEHNSVITLLLTSFGWAIENNKLIVDWDSSENITAIKKRVSFLTNGCRCKTGCRTKRCKCVRNENHCGPGCSCNNCSNTNKGKTVNIIIIITYLF